MRGSVRECERVSLSEGEREAGLVYERRVREPGRWRWCEWEGSDDDGSLVVAMMVVTVVVVVVLVVGIV